MSSVYFSSYNISYVSCAFVHRRGTGPCYTRASCLAQASPFIVEETETQ